MTSIAERSYAPCSFAKMLSRKTKLASRRTPVGLRKHAGPDSLQVVCLFVLVMLSFHPWAHAQLKIVDEAKLRFLADGMRANQSRIADVRADIQSHCTVEQAGKPRHERNVSTKWLSKGNRFKYDAHISVLVDGKPPAMPQPGDSNVMVPERNTLRAYNGEIFLDYRPDEDKASVKYFKDSPASVPSEIAQTHPLAFGTSVFGLGLDEVMEGKSWRRRPEDAGRPTERIVSYEGTRQFEDREVHVVSMTARWQSEKAAPGIRRYEIHVDPERGFTVPYVRMEFGREGGLPEPAEEIQSECAEVNGVWLPKLTTYKVYGTDGLMNITTTAEVTAIALNTGVAEDELKVTLKDGTDVDDDIAGLFYRYAAGGEDDVIANIQKSLKAVGYDNPVPFDTLAVTRPVPPEQKGSQTGTSTADAGGSTWPLVVASGILLFVPAVVVFWFWGIRRGSGNEDK
jgi:hypothetical protein